MKKLFLSFSFILCSLAYIYAGDFVYPSSIKQGNKLDVTISLQGLQGVDDIFSQATSVSVIFSQGTNIYYDDYLNTMNTFYSNQNIFTTVTANQNDQIGSYDLFVYANGVQQLQVPDAFAVEGGEKMSIVSANIPSNPPRNNILDISISSIGTKFTQDPNVYVNFHQGTSLYSYYYGQEPFVVDMKVKSDTKITAKVAIPFNAGTDTYNLSVSSDLSGTLLFENAMTISQQAYKPEANCNGNKTAKRNESLELTVSGQNLNCSYEFNNKIIFAQGTTIQDYYGDGYVYGDFESYSFESLTNNYGKASVLIPNYTEPGIYRAYFSNSICGAVDAGFDLTVTNEYATPSVEVSPSFGNAGANLEVTIFAKNSYFAQGTETGTPIKAEFEKGDTKIQCPIDNISSYAISGDINIPDNAIQGSYDLLIYYKKEYSTETIRYKNEFIVSKRMTSAMVSEFINISTDNENTYIKIDPAITKESGLGAGITYRAQLGNGADLPYWVQFDEKNMQLIIAKNRMKAWENIDVIIIASDATGKEVAFNFDTDIMYETSVADVIAMTEKNNVFGINLSPNPARDQISIVSSTVTEAQLQIANSLGNIVYDNGVATNSMVPIDDLATGIYTATITVDGKVYVEKLVVE